MFTPVAIEAVPSFSMPLPAVKSALMSPFPDSSIGRRNVPLL